MKRTIQFLFTALLLVSVLAAAGCGEVETPYQKNDAQNFTVSVKYDANGGDFTNTNTLAIVDSYDPATNGGKIALLEPGDPQRGKNAFQAKRPGYFLVGWYTQCTETADGMAYSGKWDFSTDVLTVDPNGTYTSTEPQLTLYAAWLPLFEIEYYDLATGQLLTTVSYNPTQSSGITLPVWDEETGTINMKDVPEYKDHTFAGLYLDAEGTQPVTDAVLTHPAEVDMTTATAQNTTLRLYTQWQEGQWYRIYTAEQFVKNANVNGCYELYADLDFADSIWPTALMYGNFGGTIRGNGHTLRNITFTQSNNSKVNAGMFGQLTETAQLTDVTFENVTFTVKAGTRVAGTSYGLLAGSLAAETKLENVSILASTLQIDSGCYFGTEDYVIGLVSGSGNGGIDPAGITCQPTGDAPETVHITQSEDGIRVEIVTE